MLRRQPPGSANISGFRWGRENQDRKNLSPAASRSDLQVSAPSLKLGGAREPACALPRAGGCGGSRIRISCTCEIARPLGLRDTHIQSGGRLCTSPTGWTHHGCSAPHPRGSPLTSQSPASGHSRRIGEANHGKPSFWGKKTEISYGTCWHVIGVEGQKNNVTLHPLPLIDLWTLKPHI